MVFQQDSELFGGFHENSLDILREIATNCREFIVVANLRKHSFCHVAVDLQHAVQPSCLFKHHLTFHSLIYFA